MLSYKKYKEGRLKSLQIFSDGLLYAQNPVTALQRTGYLDNVETLKLIAFQDFVEVFQHQAAFEAHAYFFNIVFKAFQRGKFAGMNNDIVANQTDV